jgi:coenzyme F420-0:L-glutamate ligase / coenzyme F420-1:gamma-L-glutamate ligase
MTLTYTALPEIPLVKPGDDLAQIINKSSQLAGIQMQDGDIFVIAQKIVSKSEGRLFNLTQVEPSEKAKELALITEKDPRLIELILRESNQVVRTRPGTIIVEHKSGFICANAGIDHSNVAGLWGNPDDWVLLLPEDSDKSAQKIGMGLAQLTGKKVGVIIIDSHGRAWRLGTVGVTIGLYLVPGLVDLRGTADLFGYKLRITQVAAADELAGGASLLMGQAAESTPVVHVRGFPYSFTDSHLSDLIRPKDMDMFR